MNISDRKVSIIFGISIFIITFLFAFVLITKRIPNFNDTVISEDKSPDEDIDFFSGMVEVEGGDFMMNGSVLTSLKSFFISDHEVTQAEYYEIIGSNPSYFNSPDNPVECVTWFDAVEFCNRLSEKYGLENCYERNGGMYICDFSKNGFRLPTEAEWEYAACGGSKSSGYRFSGSDNAVDVAWISDNSEKRTHSVKTRNPNELGLYDMSGNVWEWCWDWYSSAVFGGNFTEGLSTGFGHVKRGASWDYEEEYSEVYYRSYSYPYGSNSGLGFRIARSSVQPD